MKRLTFIAFIFILVCISCKDEKSEKPDKKSDDISVDIQAVENGLLPGIQIKGETVKTFNLLERMEHYNVPGVSIAVVENGAVKWAKGYGIANTNTGLKVDTNTLFQAGSISKPLAALAALKLVEEGLVDLDEDVNEYLKDWKIPDNEFTKDEKVSLRRLLTHTAGMTVHGFPGYKQTDTFPSVTQVLNGKGNTPKIFVDTTPGSIWRYSGGGYTVMEKVVEDVSGFPLEVYMADHILQAMDMKNSTYEQPLGTTYHANASAAYDTEGNIIEGLWHNYPEQAAAGLWTTPTDLAKYCIEIQQIMAGKENGVLSKAVVEKMLTKDKRNWGLGPSLRKEGDSLLFGHGGKNAGFSNNMVASVYQGSGVIVMTNADNGTSLMGEIIRSVSYYYNWNITKPEIIKTVDLSQEALETFTGTFKMSGADAGDYMVEMHIEDHKLKVHDKITGEILTFHAVSTDEFRALDDGAYIAFRKNDEGKVIGFEYNSSYVFERVE